MVRGPGKLNLNPEVNLVHLGLGSFHRAHQAWYTHAANQISDEWRYKSFAVNSGKLVESLRSQSCKYSLVTSGLGDLEVSEISSISEVAISSTEPEFSDSVASENTKVLTITISEAGYEDIGEHSALGRLAKALETRYIENSLPLTILSCDNLPANGSKTKDMLLQITAGNENFQSWLHENIAFPDSMVDRITPQPEPWLSSLVQERTGRTDRAPVLAEKFSEWVICGEFAAAKPDWDKVGVKFVKDLTVFENRKLWLLNGSHSLLAYSGIGLGLETVADAFGNDGIRSKVGGMWQEVAELFGDKEMVNGYTEELEVRFSNPYIQHQLVKIAGNGPAKLRTRCLPAMKRRSSELGLDSPYLAMQVVAWVRYLYRVKPQELDQESRAIQSTLRNNSVQDLKRVLAAMDPEASEDSTILKSLIEANSLLEKEAKLNVNN